MKAFFCHSSTISFDEKLPGNSQQILDGANVVYGVSRIVLPSCDLGEPLRTGRDVASRTTTDPGATDPGETGRSADFVAGPENCLAVPALERLLAESDGDLTDLSDSAQLFNPLVLLGPTGMGKSHLARGITRRWRAALDESTVEYLSAMDFARQLRAAREEGELDNFRERLANLQLFVLEDLHRLPQSTYVQRELRDTFDLLVDSGAAIVITAQQPPATMAGLEAGLRDRLSSGLTVRLHSPSVETRFELLRLAAAERGVQIDDQQLQQLAHKIEGPAPQLFRAIAEYQLAKAGANGDSQSTKTADPGTREPLKMKQIVAVVARYYSLTQAAICSSARRKSLVYARGVAIHLARSLTDLSYAQIGHTLGHRDHTTIMHANRTIETRQANDATTQQDIEELKRILTAV